MKEILAEHYINLRKIGEGAMGEVWRATDAMLERDVAVKVMKPEIASQPDFSERFLVEARALAKINHPNIVAVYTARQSGSLFWIELEYVEGTPLDKVIEERGAMNWRDAAGLIVQALQGLERAHAAGIIHRDIKPSNAIVTPDGTLKLMDFGIARVKRASKLTRTGYTLGTVAYMAPEQFQTPDKIDGRADLYSLGIMFYEMLSGSVPFQGDTEFEILDKHVRAKPPPLDKLVAPLPASVQRIVSRSLEKSADKRYPDASSFRRDIEDALAQAGTPGLRGRTAGPGMPVLAGAAAAVILLGAGAAYLLSGDGDTAREEVAIQMPAAPAEVASPPEKADAAPTAAQPAPLETAAIPIAVPSRPAVPQSLGLGDDTVVRDEQPEPPTRRPPAAPRPARAAETGESGATGTASCSSLERKIDRLVAGGDLKSAIKETATALDAGCGEKFLEKRKELVARIRTDQ